MVFFPRRRFQPLTDEKRSFERRRAQRITSEIPPELSNLMNQVLATERVGPLRRGISCYARPTYAVGSRQMQSTCTMILKNGKLPLPGCRGFSPVVGFHYSFISSSNVRQSFAMETWYAPALVSFCMLTIRGQFFRAGISVFQSIVPVPGRLCASP